MSSENCQRRVCPGIQKTDQQLQPDAGKTMDSNLLMVKKIKLGGAPHFRNRLKVQRRKSRLKL